MPITTGKAWLRTTHHKTLLEKHSGSQMQSPKVIDDCELSDQHGVWNWGRESSRFR